MERQQILRNLKSMFIGKKTLKQRLLTAIWPSLGLAFILFLFGPLDLSHTASQFVSYNVWEVVPACLKLFALVFAGLFLISWLPGGKLHAWISSLFCGLLCAFYIQGNFLNPDLGVLDGTAVDWPGYTDNALVNLGIFVLIMLIPFFLHYLSRKLWKNYVIFLSVLLLVMQTVSLTKMLIDEYKAHPDAAFHYYMEKDKEYVLGKENIVVFILDWTGPEELESAVKAYPELLKPFRDFQQFDNYSTEVFGTFPSVTTLLTHQAYDPGIHYQDWFYNSWHSDDALSFYGQMKENGWTTRIFNQVGRAAGTYENEFGLIDNIKKAEGKAAYTIDRGTFRKLIKLSFYRYFPLIMKAPFWIYTDDLNSMKNMSENEQPWSQSGSLQKFLNGGLALGEEDKVYVMYHYRGCHSPYILNENGRVSDEGTNRNRQLAGQLYAISEYMQYMKDLEIYDSSSIIISADHGNWHYPHSILFIKPAGQRQPELTLSHAPLTQLEFMPTIGKLAGISYERYGRSFFDIPENEERLRCTGIRYMNMDLPHDNGKDTNALREYCFIGDQHTLSKMMEDNNFDVIYVPYPYF